MEKFLPTANSLLELDRKSVTDCLIFVCDFTWHYFTAVSSSLRLHSANYLMIELFRLDVLYEFDASVAGRLRSAWQRGLAAAYDASDPELSQYVDRMLTIVLASVGECSQVYRLSEIISLLWHTAVSSCHPLDLSVIKQALSTSSSTLLRSPSLLALVLDHSLFVYSPDELQPLSTAESLHDARAVALAALTARFLLTSWKAVQASSCDFETAAATAAAAAAAVDDDEDDDAKSSANENIDSLNLELLIDIALAVVCMQATQAFISQSLVLHQELQQDFCRLIGQLSEMEVELLITRSMERSVTSGEVWSLVLDVILHQLESCHKELVERSLPTDPEQFVPLTLSRVSTLCVMLPRMSRDTQQHIAEITVALLLTCDIDRIAAFDSECAYVIKMTFFEKELMNMKVFCITVRS